MNVLIVTKFLHPAGGAETYVFELGKALSRLNHQVQYFGMAHEGQVVGNRVNARVSGKDFHNKGLGTLLYPFSIIYSLEARREIRKVLTDFSPDAVHLNNINFQITPSILYEIRAFEKRRGKPVKIVMTAHDYQLICPNHMMRSVATHENCSKCVGGHYLHCIKGKCIHHSLAKSVIGAVEGAFYRAMKAYRMIDTIVCPSRFMAGQLSRDPRLGGKIVPLHNFAIQTVPYEGEKGDYVLYFGRLSAEKGLSTLLKVAGALPHIRFLFAGSGPMEDEIKQAKNATFVGFKTGEALRLLIAKARFSVCPSEWYENCPFSVIESQINGTPVIGADIGGIPELIFDKADGELFESGNAEALKAAIASLWEDEGRLKLYQENCLRKHFLSAEEYAVEIIKLYK